MAKTVIVPIQGAAFASVTIPKNTYLVWHNKDGVVHSAEMRRECEPYFNAGALHPGEHSSPVYFGEPGTYEYVCRYHHGMTGRVTVLEGDGEVRIEHPDHDEGRAHTTHYHGFVTGGRSASRLFMTHTPVMADDRHRYQVILRGSLVDPAHAKVYEEARANPGFSGSRWQVFHAHMDMRRIGEGTITELEHASITRRPAGGTQEVAVAGLPDSKIPVHIDEVVHFHTFELDDEYESDGLEYILYGDDQDVFLEHYISRAPNFHSVAQLAKRPSFWTGSGSLKLTVPSKRIYDVSPKTLPRVAFIDNAFHVMWLPPAGSAKAVDPLIRRDPSPPVYDVVLEDGSAGTIEIADFVHFDTGLLNTGVFLPDLD